MGGIARCKLSEKQQVRLLEFFVKEATARKAAAGVGVEANTGAKFYQKVRQMILEKDEYYERYESLQNSSLSKGSGTIKGQKGRNTAGEIPVFGIWIFDYGHVYTKMIVDPRTGRMMDDDVTYNVFPHSIVYSHGHQSNGIVDFSDFKQFKIRHFETEYRLYTENVWNWLKWLSCTYRCNLGKQFPLFLKESEFRANHSSDRLLKLLKNWCRLLSHAKQERLNESPVPKN